MMYLFVLQSQQMTYRYYNTIIVTYAIQACFTIRTTDTQLHMTSRNDSNYFRLVKKPLLVFKRCKLHLCSYYMRYKTLIKKIAERSGFHFIEFLLVEKKVSCG